MGRPRLSIEEKVRRGTLRHHREIERLETTLTLVPPSDEWVERRSYEAIAQVYADGVADGRIVACQWVRLAIQRQAADLERAASDQNYPYVWQPRIGADACYFIEHLPHVEDTWATKFIALEPFQVWLVMALFGWRVREDPQLRRFTTLYLEVGRKSAKTTLMAALAYVHILTEGTVGAQVICGATTGTQARIVFGMMQKMGRRSLFLRQQGVQVFGNAILTADGEVRPVNSKASSQDGLNPSMIVLDESHAQDFELYGVLTSAQGSRGNPLVVCPTTAGHDLLSVGYAMHQQALKVLEGTFNADYLLALVYSLDEGDDWRDEHLWIKANPMIGVTPKWPRVREAFLKATQIPGNEAEFRVKVCSEWLHGASRWLSITDWDACEDETLSIDAFVGQRCWIGNDLASTDDLAATVLVFERSEELVAFIRCYLPAGVVELRARRVPEYQAWVDDGILIKTDGTLTDFSRIEADLRADCARFKVEELVFDQYGSQQLAGNLSNSGLPAIIEAKNAKSCTPGARDLETRVRHQKIRHEGNSLFRWFASNAQVTRRTDDSLLPKKDTAESPNKIDGIDALVAALGARLRKQQQRRREVQMVIIGGRKA